MQNAQVVVEKLASDIFHQYPIMRDWDLASMTWFIEAITNFRGNNNIMPVWDSTVDSLNVIPNVTTNNLFYLEVVRLRDNFAVQGCRVFLTEECERSYNRPT